MPEKQHILACNSIDELIRVARMPLSAYPTTQNAVWEIDFPLNKADYDALSGVEINLFGVDTDIQQTSTSKKISYSSNMTGPTFTVDNPFICVGICVMIQGESVSTQIEGNNYGPKSYLESLSNNPASPLNLRHQTVLLQALMGTEEDLPSDFTACPAVLDWGGSTWRFIWALLQAWRIVFDCPHSGFEKIIDERLSDVGSCCSHTAFQGFGDSDHPLMYITRRINHRLASITLPDDLNSADEYASFTESGYFYPLNSEQNSDGEISPYHYQKDRAAYGCPFQFSQYETWLRLPIPMPLDSNTKIKLKMERRSNADDSYWKRSLDEGTMRKCAGPVPNVASCNFPIAETDQTPDPDGGISCQTIIPGGQVRIGLGLAGFQVREGTCHLWRRVLDNKELLMQLLQGEYTPMAGTCGTPIEDNLMEMWSTDKELMRQVSVPSGNVGHPDS
jgi:hypothetical protein